MTGVTVPLGISDRPVEYDVRAGEPRLLRAPSGFGIHCDVYGTLVYAVSLLEADTVVFSNTSMV